MLISGKLANEINRKVGVLVGNPVYFLNRRKKIEKQLDDSKAVNSWLIEHPDIRDAMLGFQISPSHDYTTMIRKGVENLRSAWHYLSSTADFLSPESLKSVGRLVEPAKNALGYRDISVHLGMRYLPPRPKFISERVDFALKEASDSTVHAVERAAILHLRLAGIQPFLDGNKRTSRLYQDRLLYGADLPGAHIPVGEREIYLDLLSQAFDGLEAGNSDLQKPFVDYIGGKVNNTLDVIIGDINRLSRR